MAKYRLVDMINPRKWWAFIIGRILEKYVTFAYCEQAVYRSIMCKSCVKAGSCVGCGCAMPDALMAPGNFCSEGNWTGMMSKEEWNERKEVSGLEFNITINPSVKNK